jgi:hypothetical protein
MKTPIIWILIFLLTFFTHSKTRHTGKFSIIRDFLDNRKSGSTMSAITITKIKTKDCQIEKYLDFSIAQSRSGEVATRVLPDASICDDCKQRVETLHLAPHQKPLFFLPITLHTLTLFFLGIGFFIKYHLILLYMFFQQLLLS